MEQLISKILPKWICASEVFGLEQEVTFDEEALLVASSIPERRAEFLTGRKCAHVALSDLGVDSKPILRGPNREPLWPEGVVGSITHCGDYCAAAVARSNRDRWIGIDAESNEPLPEGVIDLIASPAEIMLAAGTTKEFPNWDRLIFSAKESVYKAWYPHHQVQLDVLDFSLKFFPESSSFDIRFASPDLEWNGSAGTMFFGRYLIGADMILTSVVVRTGSNTEHLPDRL